MLALTRKLQPVGPGRKRTRPVKKVAAPPVPVVKAAPLSARAGSPLDRRRTMKQLAAALALLAAATAPLAAQDAAVRGTFVTLLGTDTLAVERFARTADRLEGTVRERSSGTIGYTVPLAKGGRATGARVRAWGAGADTSAAPAQQLSLSFSADTAIMQVGAQDRRVAAPAGTMPYLNLSFAQLELVLQQARLRGERAAVPLLLLPAGQVLEAAVHFTGERTATVRLANVELQADLAADGRLLGGRVPAQNLSFHRTDANGRAVR